MTANSVNSLRPTFHSSHMETSCLRSSSADRPDPQSSQQQSCLFNQFRPVEAPPFLPLPLSFLSSIYFLFTHFMPTSTYLRLETVVLLNRITFTSLYSCFRACSIVYLDFSSHTSGLFLTYTFVTFWFLHTAYLGSKKMPPRKGIMRCVERMKKSLMDCFNPCGDSSGSPPRLVIVCAVIIPGEWRCHWC